MAYQKENKYWKIVALEVDRIQKTAVAVVTGYASKAAADADTRTKVNFAPIMKPQTPIKRVKLEGVNYPFTNEAAPNQTAAAYAALPVADGYFKDSEVV